MPFEIVRNDLTNMNVDAIVNAANPRPIVGYGVDRGVHKKAGIRLLFARKKIGNIAFGDVAITPAYRLNAKYVIHAVSPIWQGGDKKESELLESCYEKSLQLALEYGCESIAFPLLSAGNHGFPKELALQTAIHVFSKFLMKYDMQIYLVVFSQDAFVLSEKLFSSVKSYIDEIYTREKNFEEYGVEDKCNIRSAQLEQFKKAMEQRKREVLEYSLGGEDKEEVEFSLQGEDEEEVEFSLRGENEAEAEYSLRAEEDKKPSEYSPQRREIKAKLTSSASFEMSPQENIQAEKTVSPREMESPRQMGSLRKTESSCKTVSPRKLEDLIKEVDETFSEALIRLIDQKGMKDPDVYKRANIDRKLFSKIKNNISYKPSKSTALAFAIALELNLDETRDLIGRAGFALTHSSKFDIIVEYFLLEKNYNIFEINEVLFAFDQPLIGR